MRREPAGPRGAGHRWGEPAHDEPAPGDERVRHDDRLRQLVQLLPQAAWVALGDGTIEFANDHALALVGACAPDPGEPVSTGRLVHEQDRARVQQAWREAVEAGVPFEAEARLRHRDGTWRWYLCRAARFRESGRHGSRWLGTVVDVHDMKEANERDAFLLELAAEFDRVGDPHELLCRAMQRLCERLRATRVTLAEIDEPGGQAIVLLQSDGDEVRVETASLDLRGFGPLADEARHGAVTVIDDATEDPRLAPSFADALAAHGVRSLVGSPLSRGGMLVALLTVGDASARRWTPTEIELVRRVADRVWPAFERARADRSLAASEERLRIAQRVARMAIWECDLGTGVVTMSVEGRELFGLPASGELKLEDLRALVDPRDVDAVARAAERCLGEGDAEIEFRCVHAGGGECWIHSKAGIVSRWPAPRVVGISLNVTERRAAEEALREVSQRKDEFLAMLAHELRNPLAPIRNVAQILRLHASGQPRLQWAREVLERQTRHLTRLVDDLLDVSRIVRGQIVLQPGDVAVADVVSHAVETSRPQIRARRHRFDVHVPPGPVHVHADLMRLAQVVSNLLNNAAKYTPEGGHVTLEVQAGAAQVTIAVRDDGIGIPAALLPRVFDVFTQGERSLDRAQGGLGIGLTLVKRLVEMHGGTVEARSAGAGQGAEFVVTLPRAEPAGGAEAGARDDRARAAPARRVLVIDDNADAADSIVMLLSMEGHEAHGVHSAREGLEAVAALDPDVVLLDIGLPEMDGYEVVRRIREHDGGRERRRIVAVTGYGQEEDRARAREAGFDAHLVKPVEPDALHGVLDALRAAAARPAPGQAG